MKPKLKFPAPTPKLIFTERAIELILKALEKSVDENGYVIDKKTKKLEKDYDGDIFKPEEIMGIVKNIWITKPEQILFMKSITT